MWFRVVKSAFPLLLTIATLTPFAHRISAQTSTGSIRGYVRDPAGGPLADVQVAARNVDMGLVRGTITNPEGFYNLAGLRPGQYEISVRRIGFTMQTRSIAVRIGETTALDLQLEQAATQLSGVVVVADATTTTKTSEVGANVSLEQIRDLPTFDRNFLDLTKLVPGITPSAVNSTDKSFAAGGQPAEAVNVFVDGATYKNDVLRGGVVGQDASKGNPFPQSAVQEFRVITQNYKAEYQKAASAIITATTRTGGTQWQADGFFNNISKAYVARDAFTEQRGDARPNYSRIQAGLSASGPIIENKLFFFGTYELNDRDQPEYVRGGSAIDDAPASLNVQQYLGQFTSSFRQHLGFGKLTWAQSEQNTFELSSTIRRETDFRGFGGFTSFESSENVDIDVTTLVGNWRYAGDRWLNEAQVNWQNMDWNPTWSNGDLIGLDYQDIIRIGGKDTEQKFTQSRLSLRNDLTRSAVSFAGDHVFKMGASVDFLSYEAQKRFTENPVFRFRRAENWSRPFEASFGFGDPVIGTDNVQFGGYIQDDWSVTPKLVINLGLRWDAETNMINNDYVTPQALRDSLTGPLAQQFFVEVPQPLPDGSCCGTPITRRVIDELGGIGRYITNGSSDRPMYLGAWQPRVGASYDVRGDGRTVVFGGVGIYHDRNYWNTLLDEQFRRQYRVLRVEFTDAGPAPGCPRCVAWDPRFFDPAQLRTLSGTAGLPEVFLVANDLKPPKTYQFSLGIRRGFGPSLITLSYNGIRGHNGMNFIRATPWGGLGPNYAQAFITDDRVRTWYDAMQFQWDRPFRESAGWGGGISYTLAISEEQGRSTDLFWPFDERFPTVGDLPRRRAPGNQEHTVVANGIVRLPWDVRFSSIVSLGSGINLNGVDRTQGDALIEQRNYVFEPPTHPIFGIGHVFNTKNVDVRLEKAFGLAGGQSISVGADLFNAFGSNNFGCYRTDIGPPGSPAERDFGQPTCAALGRRLQVGMRYGFRPTLAGARREP